VVEAGLLEEVDWVGSFISASDIGELGGVAPQLFRTFQLAETPVSAKLYISAQGLHDARVNGVPASDEVLAPGWTSYPSRLRYQRYEVGHLLSPGSNQIAVMLGNGWFRGQLVWPGNRAVYGEHLALILQLEISFADGSGLTIATDETWSASPSRIQFDDIYDGEWSDLRVPVVPPAQPLGAGPVHIAPPFDGRLVARRGPAVRVTEKIDAVRILDSPSGKTIVDFGQNLVGWVEVSVPQGRSGEEVMIRHAEVLDGGELAIRPLRTAKATARYTLDDGPQTLRPTFTFFGFRYAEISGIDGLDRSNIRALVIGSDLTRTGWLETNNPALDQLHANVVWSMRGNFLDLPTDCPQRDERLGWTGDIQVFAPTASYLFDVSGLLAGWLEDLAAEQHDDGAVPYVVPDALKSEHAAAAGWGDAATVVPMALDLTFADREMLNRQYPSMRAWVGKVRSLAGPDLLWSGGPQFGDWLDPTAPPDDPVRAQADPDVVATACFVRSTRLLAAAAVRLGFDDDAREFGQLADDIAAAFEGAYVAADGRVRSDCQTVYAMALCWNLISNEERRRAAGERLAQLVEQADLAVSTGFLGTPLILDALCEAGRSDLAVGMLTRRQVPSWLYAVDMGATTIWERWDSMLPDGSINPGEMTSFNHYAYGAVADWMHRRLGGITPTSPGWKSFEVAPITTSVLDGARAVFDSPYGRIESRWQRVDGAIEIDVIVPYGTVAAVRLADSRDSTHVDSGHHTLRFADVSSCASVGSSQPS